MGVMNWILVALMAVNAALALIFKAKGKKDEALWHMLFTTLIAVCIR